VIHGSLSKASLVGTALEVNEITCQSAFVVGDRADDIDGARENGIRSIGVTWGMAVARNLRAPMHWSSLPLNSSSTSDVEPDASRCPLAQILELFVAEDWRSVYAGELECAH